MKNSVVVPALVVSWQSLGKMAFCREVMMMGCADGEARTIATAPASRCEKSFRKR